LYACSAKPAAQQRLRIIINIKHKVKVIIETELRKQMHFNLYYMYATYMHDEVAAAKQVRNR